METNTNSFFTHDNGGRPFRVDIDEKFLDLKVYKVKYPKIGEISQEKYEQSLGFWKEDFREMEENDGEELLETPKKSIEADNPVYEKLVLRLSAEPSAFHNQTPTNPQLKVFIGGSESSNPNVLGNSFLVQKNDKSWIYIGNRIYEFKPLYPIVEYYSRVGNSDVPYPYAIDELGNIYLMIEFAIIKNLKGVPFDSYDFYDLYYSMCKRINKGDSLSGYPLIEPMFIDIRHYRPGWKRHDYNHVIKHLKKSSQLMLKSMNDNLV